MTLHGGVHHDRLRRMAEHLCHVEVERAHSISLLEREVGVAGGLSHHIQRCALALGNASHVFDMLFVDKQSHALLAFVGNDFLGRESLVANRQLRHVNLSSTLFNQFRQTVYMTSRTMIVDTNHWVVVFLA